MRDIYSQPGGTELAQATATRRRGGIILGVALGLAYGLVSQLGNRAVLPGIPLYQPPAGPIGNALLSGVLGGGLGLLTTWPSSTARGILLGSLAAAVAVVLRGILQIGADMGASAAVLAAVIFAVPLTWLTVPVIALLRWAVNRQVEARRAGAPLVARLRLPVAAMVIMAVLAGFEILDPTARSELRRMDEMLAAAKVATNAAALPAPLAAPDVTGLRPGHMADYSLEWTDQDLDRFIELRPASNYDQHAAVIARFADGVTVVCLYPTAKTAPNCATY